MEIVKPSADQLAGLVALHAHRFPEKALAGVIDEGKQIKLPILLGIPTGAAAMPLGEKGSPAWSHAVAITFKQREDSALETEALVRDCVLWPEPATWMQWVGKWPALPLAVLPTLRKKIGGVPSQLEEPAEDEPLPEPLQAAAKQYPRAVWRRAKLPTTSIDLLIDAPAPPAWRIFLDAMKRGDAKHWELVRDLANGVTRAPADSAREAMYAQWPGLALIVVLQATMLGGLGADVELGEW